MGSEDDVGSVTQLPKKCQRLGDKAAGHIYQIMTEIFRIYRTSSMDSAAAYLETEIQKIINLERTEISKLLWDVDIDKTDPTVLGASRHSWDTGIEMIGAHLRQRMINVVDERREDENKTINDLLTLESFEMDENT